jgi:polysaccharide ABC transporter, permease protein
MIHHSKEVLLTISQMDLKTRYQNSKIGFLWSFLKPLLQFFAYYTVFRVFLKIDVSEDYPLRLFLGVLLWNFFVEATGNGLNSYIGKKSIVTKIKIEKEILPMASYLTALMNFLLTMIIFIIMFFVQKKIIMISFVNFFNFLIFLILYSILIISINIILATVNVLFRDLQNIWDIILTYGVFLTPIIYTITIPKEYLKLYYFLNPLAYPIEEMKASFFGVNGSWRTSEHLLSFILSVILWILIAIIVRKKLGLKVADYL